MSERCGWAGPDQIYLDYHDHEWGKPERDGRKLFEMLTLEGFQSGLSWITILRKREGFRQAFQGFDPDILAQWGEDEVARILADPGVVRHRGKIEATLNNARVWQEIEAKIGFADFIWSYVDHRPIVNHWRDLSEVPGQTEISKQIAKDLKKAGYKFCGPTTVYAFMQSAGLVNDHLIGCPSR